MNTHAESFLVTLLLYANISLLCSYAHMRLVWHIFVAIHFEFVPKYLLEISGAQIIVRLCGLRAIPGT